MLVTVLIICIGQLALFLAGVGFQIGITTSNKFLSIGSVVFAVIVGYVTLVLLEANALLRKQSGDYHDDKN